MNPWIIRENIMDLVLQASEPISPTSKSVLSDNKTTFRHIAIILTPMSLSI